ncbi:MULTISPECIES: DNA gyrase inhibitor YacG [unclassified Sphingomonas]|jgi:endogenous inhibitor of DNA gyrase (YacG/DUF329 family)|uniref:DNA gyrase inhibitor YacG n=1 Tax=unclassified Sphingomonas TaxID=196159 RepID=UPI000833091C|nr:MULTISPECIES: DNA gyrase inhibitor YacG [unclassified Sphingomonas]MCH4893200.1 DNA gyrase inhibitor YacG [Sphingomonas sp. SFZ2018-12]
MSRRATPESCPRCGKPVSVDFRPFCGRGCKDRDLLAWLDEGYRLPGARIDPDDAANANVGLDSDADAD